MWFQQKGGTLGSLKSIEKRVIQSAEEKLFRIGYVSAIDVLVGMGPLQAIHVQDWENGKIPYLEKVIQGNLHKISVAMKCFRSWALRKHLKPSEAVYRPWKKGPKRPLQFSKTNHPSLEKAYRTHYVSLAIVKAKQEELKKNADLSNQRPRRGRVLMILSPQFLWQVHTMNPKSL